jgi:hypothetical protein
VAYPHVYQPDTGRLVLRLEGTVRVELLAPASPRLQIRSSGTNSGVNLFWPSAATNFVLEYNSHPLQPTSWMQLAEIPSLQGPQVSRQVLSPDSRHSHSP